MRSPRDELVVLALLYSAATGALLCLLALLSGCAGPNASGAPVSAGRKCQAYRTITGAACRVIEAAPCPFEGETDAVISMQRGAFRESEEASAEQEGPIQDREERTQEGGFGGREVARSGPQETGGRSEEGREEEDEPPRAEEVEAP